MQGQHLTCQTEIQTDKTPMTGFFDIQENDYVMLVQGEAGLGRPQVFPGRNCRDSTWAVQQE